MVARVIAATELRNWLLRTGHCGSRGPDGAAGSDLWPSPDSIVTVALNLDPTLRPPYRQRYFACLLESEANPVPVIQFEADFAVPSPFETIAAGHPVAEGFMTGPFRWLLNRLSRCRHLLLWPSGRDHKSGDSAFASAQLLDDCPELGRCLCSAGLSEAEVGAVVLDLAEQTDCRMLWKVASYVAQSFQDFYVASLEGTEVYLMHHHDKVVISVPDPAARQALLRELIDRSNVMEDCSGYSSPIDDDDEGTAAS